MRMIAPFPASLTAIYISGRGGNTEVINTETFVDVPYEDYHNLGIEVGRVKVWKDEFQPGLYSPISALTETTDGGNTVVQLELQADFPKNRYV